MLADWLKVVSIKQLDYELKISIVIIDEGAARVNYHAWKSWAHNLIVLV